MKIFALLFASAALFVACRPAPNGAQIDAEAIVRFDPNPPVIGTNMLTVSLTNTAGQPVRLGAIDVEGNMNHAGMRPVFARLQETAPGKYTGPIHFTMGGDWFLLLTRESAAEGTLNEKVDVPGVRAK